MDLHFLNLIIDSTARSGWDTPDEGSGVCSRSSNSHSSCNKAVQVKHVMIYFKWQIYLRSFSYFFVVLTWPCHQMELSVYFMRGVRFRLNMFLFHLNFSLLVRWKVWQIHMVIVMTTTTSLCLSAGWHALQERWLRCVAVMTSIWHRYTTPHVSIPETRSSRELHTRQRPHLRCKSGCCPL